MKTIPPTSKGSFYLSLFIWLLVGFVVSPLGLWLFKLFVLGALDRP